MASNPEGTVIKKRPHTYTPEERATLSDGIDKTMDEQDELDSEKSATMAEFKSRAADLETKLQTLRRNKKQGFEVREYECSVIRNRATRTVEYVHVGSGNVIETADFTNDDWDIVYKQSQFGLFNEAGPDENVLRAEAEAAHGPHIYPNYDANGNPVAGPATDEYNRRYPNSPYKALSEHIDFSPALPSNVIEGLDAEAQVYYNSVVAVLAQHTNDGLDFSLAEYDVPAAEGEDAALTAARPHIVAYIRQRMEAPATPAPTEPAAEKPVLYPNHDENGLTIVGPETYLYGEALTVAQETDEEISARIDGMSQEEIKAKLAQYDAYDQSENSAVSFYAAALRGALVSDPTDNAATDNGPERASDEDTDDEPSEDDEPQPKNPKVPKRPAKRK